MDPNVTLERIEKAASVMANPDASESEFVEAAHDLRESVVALDEWLSNGGFYPDAWNKD